MPLATEPDVGFGLRAIELIPVARGVVVGYETACAWSMRLGWVFANTLRRCRSTPRDEWFVDEVFVRVASELHHLWWAIDLHGHVLDVLVQRRRSAKAAKRFPCKPPDASQHVPGATVSDELRSMRP